LHTTLTYQPYLFCSTLTRPPQSTLFPYTTLFRSLHLHLAGAHEVQTAEGAARGLRASHRAGCARAHLHQRCGMVVRGRHPHRARSEEHTSELQSPDHLVCRLLLEKKNKEAIQT